VKKPGSKTSLEEKGHVCPKCKKEESVRLIRSEKLIILFNKCVSNKVRVQYECSSCKWKNGELPLDALSEPLEDSFYTI
ncbi:hypothetical protein BY458DRAFT_434613, partial [Sporodiniella umbellata]